ncbi:MAG: Glycosyl transferase family 2 [Candidatus Woesebacteria bacterium GW2011_GWA1_39_21]|uniref:Glycosyl transferase family 2 n=1 Tax=Candidatus Woesebacteria bacterium GW2011_GWA1_39_21 TaxID=1618550 RepID=A0A0G0N955_9BACT|nr:MAG: Glycosyl transferase family 2 [Candidatus Woesebacteria bacterium GW2011_GWA1_39_21]
MEKVKIHFSIGICAYNEEENITNLIKSITKQELGSEFSIREILIIASGCTDNTVSIIKKLKKKNKKIRLIIQVNREGKAKAVNLFIKYAKSKYLILQSADTILDKKCYFLLLNKLKNKSVGMVGGKVIPTDNPDTFCGFANQLKWKLHHLVNLKFPERPKVGELIAFKKVFKRIPPNTAVDEASIEPLIKLQDYKVIYEEKAIVYNSGPKTIRELLSQRRRIFAGHYETKLHYGYEVITFSNFLILPVFLSTLNFNAKELIFSAFTVILEIIARIFGYLDVTYKLRDHSVWKIVTSSKNPKSTIT